MLFQIRDDDAAVIERLENLLRNMAAEVSAQGRCNVAVERIRTGAPALMDASFQQAIEAASTSLAGGKSIRMPSGAGHDAQVLATIMPAGMLFVPSIGGISHHWTENTSDADIVTGAKCLWTPAGACWRGDISVRVMPSGQGLSISGWCHPLVTPEKFYEVRCLAKSQPRGQLAS